MDDFFSWLSVCIHSDLGPFLGDLSTDFSRFSCFDFSGFSTLWQLSSEDKYQMNTHSLNNLMTELDFIDPKSIYLFEDVGVRTQD